MGSSDNKVNLGDRLAQFSEQWEPKIVATYNGNKLCLVKVKREFVWHKYDETDDFFLVISGRLTIRLRDGDVVLGLGELFVVPRGVEHCPYADEEAQPILIEPMGAVNTGDSVGPLTTEPQYLE